MPRWQCPLELPDLRRAGIIALDTETEDRGLAADRGSAWPWRGGHVCGVSIAYRADGEIRAHYLPLRHPDTDNFDPEQIFAWLRDLVASDARFVTQNGLFDWGWLRADGNVPMPPSHRLEEIGALATLIDENRYTYNLADLCAWRGLPGKDETVLQEAAEALAATTAKRKSRKKINAASLISRLPARFVGAYAEADAASTLALFENLYPVIELEKTQAAYRLEVDLLPMVLEMRRRGIRIDQAAAEHARDTILQKRDAALAELSGHLGTCISMDEIAGRKWLTQTFDAHKIKYPRTEKGNPSFTAGKSGWMATHQHWLAQLIARANKYDAAGSKFIEGHILGHIVNGRIHSEIHPHRGDDGSGTCSFRFSYSDPPLQQMPIRDKELGPLIRSVFLPEPGEVWAKPDISQQEFRLVVHYAVLRKLTGALQAAEFYRSNPDADFHAIAAQLTGLARDDAKAVNFAIIYGVGIKKFAAMIKKSVPEAQAIRAQYERKLPFLFRLDAICKSEAKRLGVTELYDGAKRHWNYYAARNVFVKGAGPCSLEEAQHRRNDPGHPWHGAWLTRHKTHTALNALIQGSAARHTKLWMRACWREGIVPLLQMHDALDCSVATREQGELVARLGSEAVRLEVPVRVDLKFGRTWGDATHSWEDVPAAATKEPPARINGAAIHIAPAAIELPQAPAAAPPAVDIPVPTVPLAALIDEPIGRDRLIFCRFHAEKTPSLKIYDDHFYCFGCNTYGNQVDWLVRVEGLEREEALHIIETWDGPLVVPAQEDASEKRAYALRWWKNARPIAGTIAEQYLAKTRHINLEMLPADIGEVLRFHPRCPFGPGIRLPCLLALMRDVATNEPVGIQRIALTPDAKKIGRRSLGSMGVAKFWPAGFQLVVGEGIETVLAAATRISHHDAALQPAWSAINAGNLEIFPVVPGVERLIILADNDANGKGQAAAETCKERWVQEGRTGEVLLPERPDTDFNDIVMERAL